MVFDLVALTLEYDLSFFKLSPKLYTSKAERSYFVYRIFMARPFISHHDPCNLDLLPERQVHVSHIGLQPSPMLYEFMFS